MRGLMARMRALPPRMRFALVGALVVVVVGAAAWTIRRKARHVAELEGPDALAGRREFVRAPAKPPRTAGEIPAAERAKSKCYGAYSRLYERDVLDVRIVFGYKDARPARYVGDRYEKAMLEAHLTAPCPPGWHACGFEKEPASEGVLRRKITGPDGLPRSIRVTLSASSVGPDDDENRRDSLQPWRSRETTAAFLDGLLTADVVFYNGHSRDGGGPDFFPPRLTQAMHVDYGWYARATPGLNQLKKALAAPGARARVLGLFSCASSGHFLQTLRAAKPQMSFIVSGRALYYADALSTMLGAMSALLGGWCEADFSAALEVEPGASTTRLVGFFR